MARLRSSITHSALAVLLLAGGLLLLAHRPVAEPAPVTVTRISPEGHDVPPGQQIVINSPASKNGEHTALHIAIRDAFEAARRQLRTHRTKPRERRHKNHERDGGAQEDTGLPITA